MVQSIVAKFCTVPLKTNLEIKNGEYQTEKNFKFKNSVSTINNTHTLIG